MRLLVDKPTKPNNATMVLCYQQERRAATTPRIYWLLKRQVDPTQKVPQGLLKTSATIRRQLGSSCGLSAAGGSSGIKDEWKRSKHGLWFAETSLMMVGWHGNFHGSHRKVMPKTD